MLDEFHRASFKRTGALKAEGQRESGGEDDESRERVVRGEIQRLCVYREAVPKEISRPERSVVSHEVVGREGRGE